MFIVANLLGSTVQISMLPLPVLSTLQAAGLVFNSICATLILREPFTRWSLAGTMLVTTGAVLIAVFGAIPSPAHDLAELLALLTRRAFVVWMIVQACLVALLAVAIDVLNETSSLSHSSRFRLARGIVYGVISGDLSAHALLFAKSAVELAIKTIGGRNQFAEWQSWAIVLALVSLALCQLYYLHRGLKLVSTSVLYPLVFCVYNIVAILDGLIYFNQTSLLSPLHACLIALGTVVLLSGVLALSWRLSDEQHTPGVGQSTLAPGLGLVNDTEGEEEEAEERLEEASLLLGSEAPLDSLEDPLGYQTFPAMESERRVLRRSRRKRLRWAERAQIWDELQDQEEDSPSLQVERVRSSTLPASTLLSPLLLSKGQGRASRSSSSSSPAAGDDLRPNSEPGSRKVGRRRRKSTGFPGLTARRVPRGQEGSSSRSLAPWLSPSWWTTRGRLSSVSDPAVGPAPWRRAPEADEEASRRVHGPAESSLPPPR